MNILDGEKHNKTDSDWRSVDISKIRESESTWKETECDIQNAEQINKSESN